MKHDDPRQFGFGLDPAPLFTLPPLRGAQFRSASSTHDADAVLPVSPRLSLERGETGSSPETPGMEPKATLAGSTTKNAPARAMAEVLALRWRQINQFGHTPESDRALSLDRHFARLIGDQARDVIDNLQFNKREAARRYLLKLAALSLATIDRIDAEEIPARGEEGAAGDFPDTGGQLP